MARLRKKDVLALYLDRYADDGGDVDVSDAVDAHYVVVVPAFDESIDDLPITPRNDVLTIVVVNVPDHLASNDPRVERTATLLRELSSIDSVLAIDRVSRPIPKRQGVGLARKIGCDAAARLIATGKIVHPVIFSTDADVELPPGYFEATAQVSAPTTWVYPFRHRALIDEFGPPIELYEAHMRHYVHGLDAISSPYAYHSLGSLIAVHVDAYAAVRGIPRKNAGEDFYMLNKLAKVAPITRLTEPVMTIEARPSERVPFGTGPAIRRIQGERQSSESFLSYDARSFGLVEEMFAYARRRELPGRDTALGHVIDKLGYREPLQRLFDRDDPDLRPFHTWFDGFRTMKTIRTTRSIYPDVPLGNTLETLFPDSDDPWSTLREVDLRRDGSVGIPGQTAESRR